MSGTCVDVKTLKAGDVVVIIWHDASTFRDTTVFYTPTNVGVPGVCNLTVGVVVTNEGGYVRIAHDLSYIDPDDEVRSVRNTYIELPHCWLNDVQVFGSAIETLRDIWDKAGV